MPLLYLVPFNYLFNKTCHLWFYIRSNTFTAAFWLVGTIKGTNMIFLIIKFSNTLSFLRSICLIHLEFRLTVSESTVRLVNSRRSSLITVLGKQLGKTSILSPQG